MVDSYALGFLKVEPERPGDNVIDNDVILVWAEEKRVITGADILGRLMSGIASVETLSEQPRQTVVAGTWKAGSWRTVSISGATVGKLLYRRIEISSDEVFTLVAIQSSLQSRAPHFVGN